MQERIRGLVALISSKSGNGSSLWQQHRERIKNMFLPVLFFPSHALIWFVECTVILSISCKTTISSISTNPFSSLIRFYFFSKWHWREMESDSHGLCPVSMVPLRDIHAFRLRISSWFRSHILSTVEKANADATKLVAGGVYSVEMLRALLETDVLTVDRLVNEISSSSCSDHQES